MIEKKKRSENSLLDTLLKITKCVQSCIMTGAINFNKIFLWSFFVCKFTFHVTTIVYIQIGIPIEIETLRHRTNFPFYYQGFWELIEYIIQSTKSNVLNH